MPEKKGNAEFALLAIAIVAIVAVAVWVSWPSQEERNKQRTEKLVVEWTLKLSKEKVESGTYKRFEGPVLHEEKTTAKDVALIELPVQDAWGNPLVALYVRDQEEETVKVISASTDGELATDDDIFRSAKTGLRKAIKQEAKDLVRETGKQWTVGVVDGFKESFKRKKTPETKDEKKEAVK